MIALSAETASGVRYYGYRYYSPELGRWVSRDPIGERGGINLFVFVANDAVGGIDLMGLFLRRKECVAGRDLFWKWNQWWKDAVEALGTATPKCILAWEFDECCPKGLGGDHRSSGEAGQNKIFTIRLCCNNQKDVPDLFGTIVHELTHFIDDCKGYPDFKCNDKPIGSKERDVCHCSEILCKEYRAFRMEDACRSRPACWERIKKGKYLKEGFCALAYQKGATDKELYESWQSCNDPPYPFPSYPDPRSQ